jgi:hypothetical protein
MAQWKKCLVQTSGALWNSRMQDEWMGGWTIGACFDADHFKAGYIKDT